MNPRVGRREDRELVSGSAAVVKSRAAREWPAGTPPSRANFVRQMAVMLCVLSAAVLAAVIGRRVITGRPLGMARKKSEEGLV